jgi:hypothetical protein
MATLLDRLKILLQLAAAFKRTVYEKWLYGGTMLPKAYNVQAVDLLYLKEKGRSCEGATLGGLSLNTNISANSNLYLGWL